ncbi:MAG: zinc ribbon domain-containing protein [Dehalococcoidales bacterium]|jgi:putative FmdB family regulatory protein
MPIYEFYCPECGNEVSILSKSVRDSFTGQCPTCGGKDLRRLVTSFAYHRSTSSVWESSGEPGASPGKDYYRDPRNIGRWTEKKFRDMGTELPGQLKEQIQAAREGNLPDSIKKAL